MSSPQLQEATTLLILEFNMPPTTQKLTSDQFAEKIKSQYPAYKDLNNQELTKKMLAKYPQYADKIRPSGVGELPSNNEFKGGLMNSLSKVPGEFADVATKGLPLIGGIAGGIAGGALGGLAATPTVLGIPAGVAAGSAIGSGLGAAGGEAAKEAIQGKPVDAGTVATTGAGFAAADLVGGPLAVAGGKAALGSEIVQQPLNVLKTTAKDYILKALKIPSKSPTGVMAAPETMLKGMETLYQYSKGMAVQTLNGTTIKFDPTQLLTRTGLQKVAGPLSYGVDPLPLLQAFTQTKQMVWDKVLTGLDRGSSIKVNVEPVVKDLQKTIDTTASTQLKRAAQTRLNEVVKAAEGGPKAVQDYLTTILGPTLKADKTATEAPGVELAGKLYGQMTEALDSSLESAKGATIAPFKAQYAALKSMEAPLTAQIKKAMAGAGGKLPDYVDQYGNLSLIEALVSHNPAFFLAKGGFLKAIGALAKAERDPFVNLESAFKAIDKYGGGDAVEQAPTLALPSGLGGAPKTQVFSGAPIKVAPKGANMEITTPMGITPK